MIKCKSVFGSRLHLKQCSRVRYVKVICSQNLADMISDIDDLYFTSCFRFHRGNGRSPEVFCGAWTSPKKLFHRPSFKAVQASSDSEASKIRRNDFKQIGDVHRSPRTDQYSGGSHPERLTPIKPWIVQRVNLSVVTNIFLL